MKKLAALLAALLLICIFVQPLYPRADLGDFSGGSDYGGSDWSSSSSDWGSSSWSSSGSSHYYGSSGSGSADGAETIFMFIIITVIVIVIISKSKKSGASSAPRAAGATRTEASRLRPMSDYTALDPAFSSKKLQEHLSNIYVRMQNGCTDKNIEGIRPYFADPLYQQFDRQIRTLKSTGRTNYVERIAVLDVNLRGWYQESGEDHIIAEIKTRITDYTLEDATGKLVAGDRNAEKFMTYEYNLSRPTGTLTEEAAKVTNRHCPNCGAPLSANETAKCPYCDSVITFHDHDWTINAIKGISQRTVKN